MKRSSKQQTPLQRYRGAFAYLFGPVAVFYLMGAIALGSVVAFSFVSAKAIEHDLERGLDAGGIK